MSQHGYGQLLRQAAEAALQVAERGIGEAFRWATEVADAPALTVRVPSGLPADVAAALTTRLTELVSRRSAELWRPPRLRVTATEPDVAADRITVLLGDRPAAVVRAPSTPIAGEGEGEVEAVVQSVDTAIRRRPSMLFDVARVARATARPTPDQTGLVEGALAYLLDNGVSVDRVKRDLLDALARQVPGAAAAAELGELLVEEFAPREIVVEAAVDTLRIVKDPRPDDIVRAREALYASTGLQFPDVRLLPVNEPPGTLRIRLNDVTLDRTLGVTAGWQEVVAAVQAGLHEAAPWFVRISEVDAALNHLRGALPDLIELVRRCYSDALLASCMREMLRHGDSVRNLPRILWLLLEVDDDVGPNGVSISDPLLLASPTRSERVPSNPVTLAARVRREAAEDLMVFGSPGDDDVVRLPVDLEAALMEASNPAELAAAEHRLLGTVPLVDRPLRVVVRSVCALPPVRSALQALPYPPHVVSTQELGLASLQYGVLPFQVHI